MVVVVVNLPVVVVTLHFFVVVCCFFVVKLKTKLVLVRVELAARERDLKVCTINQD